MLSANRIATEPSKIVTKNIYGQRDKNDVCEMEDFFTDFFRPDYTKSRVAQLISTD